jgi:hypothetical protein
MKYLLMYFYQCTEARVLKKRVPCHSARHEAFFPAARLIHRKFMHGHHIVSLFQFDILYSKNYPSTYILWSVYDGSLLESRVHKGNSLHSHTNTFTYTPLPLTYLRLAFFGITQPLPSPTPSHPSIFQQEWQTRYVI